MKKSLLWILLLCAAAHPAWAATNPATNAATNAANTPALYQGADRHERLVAAAQKEGELTVYHVYPSLTVVMAAFTKKYGIKDRKTHV